MKKHLTLLLLTLFSTVSLFTVGQTAVSLVSPPASTPTAPAALTGSCGANYPQLVQIVCTSPTIALTGTFKYLLNGIPPTVSESRGLSALGGNAFYTYATPITTGLAFYPASNLLAVTTSSTLTAATTVNYTFYIFDRTDPGYTSGTTSVCTADATLRTISLGTHTGQVVKWESSTDGGITWVEELIGVNHNHGSSLTYSGRTVTTYFRAVVQSGYDTTPANEKAFVGACSLEYSSVSIVTVYPYPAAPTVGSNSPVCSGNTVNLTASAPLSSPIYAWTGPASFSSGLANPSIASSTTAMSGTYSCTVTQNGCTSPAATVSVTVNQTPSAPVLSSNTPVCTGSNLNMAVPTPLAGASYNWTGPNSFNSTATNPTVINASIAAAGTYSATATVLGCTGPVGTTNVVMKQTPIAPIAASNSEVCAEGTLNLTATTIAGADYTWVGPNSFAPVTAPASQNPSIINVTTAATGTYTVFATVAGCPGASTSTNVVVNALPAIPTLNSNTPICQGTTLALTANTVAGATYNWTGPNGFSSSIQNPTILTATTAASGTYNATVNETATGCTSHLGSTTVVVNPTPVTPTALSNSPVCFGGTLNLTASTIASASYAWTGPNGFTSATQNPSLTNVTAAATGAYSVVATVTGCPSVAGIVNVVITPNPSAPALSSNSAICAGDDLKLFAGNVTGATYAWTGPVAFSSTSQNPVRTAALTTYAGTYSLIATVSGCSSIAATIDVVVNPIPAAPAASSNSSVCAGNTLNLSASTIATAAYSWSGPNSFTATTQTPSIASVTAAAAGVYSVTATVKGCVSPAGTTTVVIVTPPVAPAATNNGPLCAGQSLTLSAGTVAGATSYAWTGPNGFTSAVQNPPAIAVTTAATGGIYNVIASNGACPGIAGSTSVVINAVPAAPTASNSGFTCAGGFVNLSATTVPGATYNWTGPGFASSLQNPAILNATAANSGNYTVAATLGACTSVASNITVVTVTATPATPAPTNSGPICVGSTLTLNTLTVAGATYNWTGPNGFTSAAQNPTIPAATTAASGTYSVTVTVGGCTSLAGTTTAVVNAIPSPPVASSNSSICVGSTLNLFASTISGASAYTWTGPSAFGSALQNPTRPAATAAFSGPYSVTVTVNGCISVAATTNVTVIAPPATPIVTTNSAICAGDLLTLSATFVAGATYNWTGPNAFTANTQNPTIPGATVAAAGTYSVIATIGTCSSTAGIGTVVVTPLPAAPTPASNSAVCTGSPLNLTSNTVASAIYAWTGPNGFTSAAQNPVIASAAAADAGIYSVTVKVSGCTSPVASTPVTVNPIPGAPVAATTAPPCSGGTVSLSATSTPSTAVGETFNWSGPASFTSTLQNPSVPNATAANNGVYSVTASKNGCTSAPGTVTVTVITSPAAPTATSNGPVCVGSSLSLMASTIAGATYAWTGPNGFTSAVQNPPAFVTTGANQSGTYSVIASASGCPSQPGTIDVAVNAIPPAPTATNSSPVCSGSSLDLFASPIPGALYTWSGPNSFSSPLQNPSINNIPMAGAGTYSVFATVAGCVGPTGTTTVTINATPAAPLAGSNSPLCVGANLNLTASTIAGATYTWAGPNGFSTTTQNPTITGVAASDAGTYFVTATVGTCTGPAGIAPVSISASPAAPVATNSGPVCAGTQLTLSANTITGAVYNWTGPGGFTSSDQNPVIPAITVAGAGTYSVVATVGGGCTGVPGTTTVTVKTAPAAPVAGSNSPICSQSALTLTASTVAGATYNWTGPNSFTSTSQNPTIASASLAASGTYNVQTTAGGCSSALVPVSVIVNVTPNAPVALSNSPLCVGSTLNLTASSIAGAVYTWTGPNSFAPAPGSTPAAQNPSIASVTTAASGTYSVTAKVGACSSPAGTTNVTVNTIPAAPVVTATPGITFCEGQTLTLQAATIVGAVYNWSAPNGFTSSDQNPVIPNTTVADGVTYSVIATVAGVCSSPAGTIAITIKPGAASPVASTSGPICSESTVQLNSTTVAGATYSWTGPNGFTSSAQNPQILNAAAASSGTYAVQAINPVNSCPSTASSVLVVVNQTPNAPVAGSDSPLCAGATLHLTASTITGATYSWTGPGFIQTAQNPTIPNVTSTNSGIYNVKATVNGCVSPTASTTVVVNGSTNAGTIAGSTTVCGETNSGTLTLSGQSGTILNWLESTDNGASWVVVANTTTTQNYTNLSETTQYEAVVQQGNCPAGVSGQGIITVIPEAVGGSLTSTSAVAVLCENINSGTLTLNNSKGTIVQWETSTDGGTTWDTIPNTTDQESYLNLAATTAYRVFLHGCTTTAYSEVKVLEVSHDACGEGLLIASLVTPNGDKHNDTWMIDRIDEYPPMSVQIINRYGTQMYQADAYANDWGATFNGDPLPAGTYFYILKVSGTNTIYKGSINVMK